MLNSSKCRLCIEHCSDRQQLRSLFNEDGSENYVYDLIVKYFSPQFLDMGNVKHLTSICLKCWNHICEFNNFQRTIYAAHVRLIETDLNIKDEPEEFIGVDNDAPNNTENCQTNQEEVRSNNPNISGNAGGNQESINSKVLENETCTSLAIDLASSVSSNELQILAPIVENSNKEVFQRLPENNLENSKDQSESSRKEIHPYVQIGEEQPFCPTVLVGSNDLSEGDIVLDIIEDEEESDHDRCGDNLPTLNENLEFIATDKPQKGLESIQIDEENIQINFELVEDEEENVTTNTPEPCGTQQETVGVGLTRDKVQNDNTKTLGNFKSNNPPNDVECSQENQELVEIKLELEEGEDKNVTANNSESPGNQQETNGIELTLDKVPNNNPKLLGNSESNNARTDQEFVEIKLELEEDEKETANAIEPSGTKQETTGVVLALDKVQNDNPKRLRNSESSGPQRGLEFYETDKELIEIKLELEEDEHETANTSEPSATKDKVQNHKAEPLGNFESNNPQRDLKHSETDQEFIEIKLEVAEDENVASNALEPPGIQQEKTGVDLTQDKVQNHNPNLLANPQKVLESAQTDQELIEIKLELDEDEKETGITTELCGTLQETCGDKVTLDKVQHDNPKPLGNSESQRVNLQSETGNEIDEPNEDLVTDNANDLSDGDIVLDIYSEEEEEEEEDINYIELQNSIEEQVFRALEAIENENTNTAGNSANQQFSLRVELEQENGENENVNSLRNSEARQEYFIVKMEQESDTETEAACKRLVTDESNKEAVGSSVVKLELDEMEFLGEDHSSVTGKILQNLAPIVTHASRARFRRLSLRPTKNETQNRHNTTNSNDGTRNLKILGPDVINNRIFKNSTLGSKHLNTTQTHNNADPMGENILEPHNEISNKGVLSNIFQGNPKSVNTADQSDANVSKVASEVQKMMPANVTNSHKRVMKKFTVGSIQSATENLNSTHSNVTSKAENILRTNDAESVFLENATQTHNNADSNVATNVENNLATNLTNEKARSFDRLKLSPAKKIFRNLNTSDSSDTLALSLGPVKKFARHLSSHISGATLAPNMKTQKSTENPNNVDSNANDAESVFLENATQTQNNADLNVATNVENNLAPNLTSLSPTKKISRNLNTHDSCDTLAPNLRNVKNFKRLSLRPMKKITRHLNTHDSGDTFAANMSPHESTGNTNTNDSSRNVAPNMVTEESTKNPNNVDSNATLASNVTNTTILNTTQIANTANPTVTAKVLRVLAPDVINSSKRIKHMLASESVNDSRQSSNAADKNVATKVQRVLEPDIINSNKRIEKWLASKSISNMTESISSLESDSNEGNFSSQTQGAKGIEASSLTTPSVSVKENSVMLSQISSNTAIYGSGSSGVPSEEEENPNSIMEKGKGEKTCWFTVRKRTIHNLNNAYTKVAATLNLTNSDDENCTQQTEEESTERPKGGTHRSSSSISYENMSLATYKRKRICYENPKISKLKNRKETERSIVEANNRDFQPLKTTQEIKTVENIEHQQVDDDANSAKLKSNQGNLRVKCVAEKQKLETSDRSSIEATINQKLEIFKEPMDSKEIISGLDNKINVRPHTQGQGDKDNVPKQGKLIDKTLLKKAFDFDVSDEDVEEESDTSSVTEEMSENLPQAIKCYIPKADMGPNQSKTNTPGPQTPTTTCFAKQQQPIPIKRALEFDNESSENEKNLGSATNTSDEEENSNDNNSKLPRYRYRLKTVEEYDQFIAKWKPQLNCELCNVTCTKFTLLREHFAEQHPSEECYITCCQIQFRYRCEIVKHIYYHEAANNGEFKCDICYTAYPVKGDLNRHMQTKHSDCPKPKVTHKCNKCEKTFVKATGYRIHLEFCDGRPPDNSKTQVSCEKCGKISKNKKSLRKHILHEHPENDKQYQCQICDQICKSKQNLKSHFQAVHTTEDCKYYCKWCPKTYRTSSLRLTHYKRVHTQLYKEEWFKKREQVKNKRYKCTECDKVYRTTFALSEHMAQHRSNTTPLYKCKYCNNGYKYSSNLSAHVQRVHPEKYNGKVKGK
ncbi:uncharacterized protein [Musca autumnalis]|uniref:uncharacterized protein n=1 Tax=Musca autumnalis TaxID=221902 RepID=UPI003CF3E5D0